MFKNVRSGLFAATAVFVALAPAQAWACNPFKPKTCNPLPVIQDAANNVVNATTNTAAQAVGYSGFAAAQAAGYANTTAMNAANTSAKANGWVNLPPADTASKAVGFKNYADALLRDYKTAAQLALYTSNTAASAAGYVDFAAAQVNGYANAAAITAANNVAKANNWAHLAHADAVSKSGGFTNFAAAQANGYSDRFALEGAVGLATFNEWSNLVAADTASKAMGFTNYAARMAADSVAVGRDQYEGLRNSALQAYTGGSNTAKGLYETTRGILTPYVNTSFSVLNYVKGICVNQATNNWGKITPFVNKVNELSPNGKAAVYRILRTLGRGSTPDRQTMRDMKVVGQALGMVTANGLALVGNAYQSNWGISLGASGGWIAGVNSSVSFSMDTYPTNGQYKMAIAVNSGVQVAAGTGTLAPGASIGFGLGWGPGSSVDASGVTMTAGGAVGGIDVAAQWTIPPVLATAMANDAKKGSFSVESLTSALTGQLISNIQAVCQAPGISAGVSLPTPGNLGDVRFSPGYTQVVWKGSVN